MWAAHCFKLLHGNELRIVVFFCSSVAWLAALSRGVHALSHLPPFAVASGAKFSNTAGNCRKALTSLQ
jgi:hypothetical protein